MRTRFCLAATLCLQLLVGPWAPSAQAAPSADDQRMVGVVAARIFAQAAPIEGWAWPPLVAISDNKEVNAFATIYNVKLGEKPDVKDEGKLVWITLPEYDLVPSEEAISAADLPAGDDAAGDAAAGGGAATESTSVKRPDGETAPTGVVEHPDGTVTQPIIVLNQGFLDKIVLGNPDRLAAVFGHETSHILLRHVDGAGIGAALVANIISRQQEADADVLGMKLGLKANFPYKGLVSGILGMRDNGNYNSFEGLNASHPGWTDRVAMIDDQQKELWMSISAFENGVEFLTIEQYQLAIDCFEQVVRDCPKCYEGYANLGYAQLMMYCDALRDEDLRYLDIGQLVVGGFYRRPESMEGTRGIGPNRKLWLDAVGNLRQAIILNPDLVLVKANLAVAYLVNPDGKDVGKAEELFTQVREALASGKVENMPPLVRASLLVNAGVAEIEGGDAAAAETLFAEAQSLYAATAETDDAKDDDTDEDDEDNKASGAALASAIHYNRGRMYAAANDPTQHESGIQELEAYLTSSSSAANWWPIAYEKYVQLCGAVGVEPKAESEMRLTANTQYRKVTGIAIPDGPTITLNESPEALEQPLGKGHAQVVVKGSDVRRLQYFKLGMEILCDDQHIVAIRLRGPKSPAVVLQASGLGGELQQVRTGMTIDELDALLGGDADQWDQRYGTNTQVVYRFYTRLGFGVRLDGNKISEIIVAQIPHEAKVK